MAGFSFNENFVVGSCTVEVGFCGDDYDVGAARASSVEVEVGADYLCVAKVVDGLLE